MSAAPETNRFEYAVVGAGPAGALAAAGLAARGRDVALFDWAPRAEKPCGGGVPTRGMERFGALLDGVPRNEARSVRVVGPGGEEARVELATPLAIFARSEMDEALRRRAQAAGATRIGARVVGLAPRDEGFELRVRRGVPGPEECVVARYVVAADGAAGLVRKRLLELAGAPAPGPEQFSRTITTYPACSTGATRCATTARGDARAQRAIDRDVLELAWVRGMDGYGWTFPRVDHASIGWCVQGPATRRDDLRQEFDGLVTCGALSGPLGEPGVGALIPSYRGLFAAACVVEGERFALVGDAAGAVDPITREGIHHAMASGAALADCDPLYRPGRYAAWYATELRPELAHAARIAPTFFSARFLTTMVRALSTSAALRDVFRDLVAGRQEYATLRRRLLRALPRSLPALAWAALRSGSSRAVATRP